MQLNDEADDAERQLLLPFVVRRACAATLEVECEREAYISARVRWGVRFRDRLTILEGALAIGRQADVSAPEGVRTRLEGVQLRIGAATSLEDHPLVAKVQGWLAGVF